MFHGKHFLIMDSRTEIGRSGEGAASSFLINNNYRIIHRNFHLGRMGEIDIIAEKSVGFWPFLEKSLVFVEVKTLVIGSFKKEYDPEMRVDGKKQERLIRLASLYLSKNKIKADTPWQIDVIAVEIESSTGNIKEIRHHENAVHL